MQEHINLKHDHESEKEIRRKYQNERLQTQRQLDENQRELVSCRQPSIIFY